MTLEERALEHRRLRTPRENRSLLVEPPLAATGDLLARNGARLAQARYDFHGRSLAELRAAARGQLLAAARAYTASYRDLPAATCDERILMAGHQPELFHPGVWAKNFALSALAKQEHATAINLVVDSDTLKTSTLRVPTGSLAQPLVEVVAFDRPAGEIPQEERSILDRAAFESFGRRGVEAISSLVSDPLLAAFWPLVLRRAAEQSNLGTCFAQARHQLEASWGLATLELPQSRVCALESFLWFTAHLLRRLPEFRGVYNDSVAEYRRVNHIRSAHHPVPDLAAREDWLEAPFWVWRPEAPRRRRLFVRQRQGEIELALADQLLARLPGAGDDDLAGAVLALKGLAGQGIKLRSRAIVTTLFARLLLADLFMHGIGGAKYDELTDALIQRFFGIEPPRFMVLSATLMLPIAREPVSPWDQRHVEQRLRELTFHPERFLDGEQIAPPPARQEVAQLVAAKQAWIATSETRGNARERCQAIRAVNEQLQPWLATERRRAEAQRERLAIALRAENVLAARDYAFCLYPEKTLRDFLLAIGAATS